MCTPDNTYCPLHIIQIYGNTNHPWPRGFALVLGGLLFWCIVDNKYNLEFTVSLKLPTCFSRPEFSEFWRWALSSTMNDNDYSIEMWNLPNTFHTILPPCGLVAWWCHKFFRVKGTKVNNGGRLKSVCAQDRKLSYKLECPNLHAAKNYPAQPLTSPKTKPWIA